MWVSCRERETLYWWVAPPSCMQQQQRSSNWYHTYHQEGAAATEYHPHTGKGHRRRRYGTAAPTDDRIPTLAAHPRTIEPACNSSSWNCGTGPKHTRMSGPNVCQPRGCELIIHHIYGVVLRIIHSAVSRTTSSSARAMSWPVYDHRFKYCSILSLPGSPSRVSWYQRHPVELAPRCAAECIL